MAADKLSGHFTKKIIFFSNLFFGSTLFKVSKPQKHIL